MPFRTKNRQGDVTIVEADPPPESNAVVQWGPDFGDQAGNDNNTYKVGVDHALEKLVLKDADFPVGVDHALEKLVLKDADFPVGVGMTGVVNGPIFWQSVSTATADAGAFIEANAPAGVQEDELLVAFVGASDPTFLPLISQSFGFGTWTQNLNTTQTIAGSGAASNTRCRIFWKRWVPGETVYRFDIAPFQVATLEIHRFIGAAVLTNPTEQSNAALYVATDLDPDPAAPGVTTSGPNRLVLAHMYHDHLLLDQVHNPPAGHIKVTDFQAVNGVSGARVASTTAWRVFSDAAATGEAEFDCSETVATDAITQRFALRPGTTVLS